jgi:hypothetical protein
MPAVSPADVLQLGEKPLLVLLEGLQLVGDRDKAVGIDHHLITLL